MSKQALAIRGDVVLPAPPPRQPWLEIVLELDTPMPGALLSVGVLLALSVHTRSRITWSMSIHGRCSRSDEHSRLIHIQVPNVRKSGVCEMDGLCEL